MSASRTLILGMGNPILSDDSVGVRLARDVGRALGERPDVDVVEECSVGGLNLLDYLTGYARVVVMDAIHTRDGVPGDLYRFDARRLRATAHLCNIHDANFATALELGRLLGMALPRDENIHVFAVEIVDDRTFGTDLTSPLALTYPARRDAVVAGVRALLDGCPGGTGEDDHGKAHHVKRRTDGTHPPAHAG